MKLYDYQTQGVRHILNHLIEEKGFLLCDEMGLGKTIQALQTVRQMRTKLPILVVAPSSCIHVWSRGDIKNFPDLGEPIEYVGANRTFGKSRVVITSYETLVNAYKSYINVRLDTGQLSNDELIRLCQVNNISIAHLSANEPNIYRRELLAVSRKVIPILKKSQICQSDIVFMQQKWGFLIMDEVHKIKNPKSNRCTAVGFVNAEYRLGLTGTPIMNYPQDLFTIWKFGLAMFQLEYDKIKSDPNSEYCKNIMDRIMLRRIKSEIEELKSVLPKRIKTSEEQILPWYENSDQKMKYIHCKRDSLSMYYSLQALEKQADETSKEFNTRKRSLNMSFMAKMQTLRQICLGIPASDNQHMKWYPSNHSVFHPWIKARVKTILLCCRKFDQNIQKTIIREFVDLEQGLILPSPKMIYVYDLLQTYKKIIVFSTFKTFLHDIMQPWLRQIGILSALFCGGSRTDQDKALKIFEKEEDVRVLLLVKTAGAEGLNLQKMAAVCVIMDPHFNLALDEQAAQRIDRIGQEHEVIVRKLYMEGSVDEAIKKMQDVKQIDIEAWNKKEDVKTIRTHGLYLQKYDTVK